ncbi:hypothetical protein H9L10_08575 [Phycicoccus endophyticus]|uniref:Uncharacterized protein n=1 Tax=Phycicoccus endophyticus TaxID=1690220 RepID=A0A7G9QYH8_9MICO|nr:hypothetical protein [Phycicoccus endophyticus]NHI19302.1 hypothetical protein [Phycicoccus endophyticus]QNN48403.1 hypothetical protein H9L10_08575 [Phycicoccus endophyticus]
MAAGAGARQTWAGVLAVGLLGVAVEYVTPLAPLTAALGGVATLGPAALCLGCAAGYVGAATLPGSA